MRGLKILPGRGRGTARSAVEGYTPSRRAKVFRGAHPSTMLRMVPFPSQGRI
jgi:hypothetical protein